MKKTALVILAVIMLLALAACGGQNDRKEAAEAPAEAAAPAEGSAAAETAEEPPEEDAPPVVLDESYTDEEGRTFVTYTSRELLNKLVELEDAGYDPFKDFGAAFPHEYIQVPVEFVDDYVINSVDHAHMDFFVEIQKCVDFDNGGEQWIVMPCFGVDNVTENGADSLMPEFTLKFGDGGAEEECRVPAEREAEMRALLDSIDDPYQPYLIRCRITEFKHMDITVRGVPADHGYSCEMYVADIVPLD